MFTLNKMDDRLMLLLFLIWLLPFITSRRRLLRPNLGYKDGCNDGCNCCDCDNLGTSMNTNVPTIPKDYVAHIKKMCGYGCTVLWRIIGGRTIKQGHWPWMATITEGKGYESNALLIKCGGFLISQQYVLTVASCVSEPAGMPYTVKLGDIKLNRDCEKLPHQTYNVSSSDIKIYPGNNALALLKLDRKVDFGTSVRPICLPFPSITKRMTDFDKVGYVAGWGASEVVDSYSLCLKEAKVKVVCPDVCLLMYNNSMDEDHLCVVPHKGKHLPSKKDEGGPLMVLSCKGQWIAYGVNKLTNLTDQQEYFNTTYFMHWIVQNSDLNTD